MENLPYFLFLLKKNVLLYSIVVNSSFSHTDLAKIEHTTYSENAIDFHNFCLGADECFPSVNVIVDEDQTSFLFNTTSSKYFENPERYFQRNSLARDRNAYEIFGKAALTRKKSLGDFDLLGSGIPPATVSVSQSSINGYIVTVTFYKHKLQAPLD